MAAASAPNGLAHGRDKIIGGLLTPKDETGDCFKFTNALAKKRAEQLGLRFSEGTEVKRLDVDDGRVRGVVANWERLAADAFVVALGSYSPLLLKRYDIKLPVYPVKVYSLTIPIADASRAPEPTIMNETYKIAITRLGDRIRVGGMAEISDYTNDLGEARRRTLEHSVMDLFPGGDARKATSWSSLRPMTPDGTVSSPTTIAGLFLNTGHGTFGWTMSSGSGRVIADLVSGRKPAPTPPTSPSALHLNNPDRGGSKIDQTRPTSDALGAVDPYSQAVKIGELLFVSGQLPSSGDGEFNLVNAVDPPEENLKNL